MPSLGPRRITATLFGVGGLFLLGLSLVGKSRTVAPTGRPTVTAERGRLDVTLVEPGTLQAERSVTLSSELRSNRAKIVFLLADGSWVKSGDVVVRFDPTPFEEERTKALGEERDGEAALTRADEERKLQVARAEEALESAKSSARLAEINLQSFEKGTGALNLREAEVNAAGAGSELERSRQELHDVEAMLGKGFVSQAEVARQKAKVQELERQSGLQTDKLRAARDVTYPRELERVRTQLQEAKDAVARAEAVLYYTHEFYRAALESAERKVETTREALRVADEQLTKTSITSPIDGFLILQDIPLEAGKRRPQIGDSVWSGVPIATVPDLGKIVTQTRVREVDLYRIRSGLPASVALEAYPDLVLRGKISFIGSLAEAVADSPWKFFTVSLALDRTDPRIRPGMSVRVAFELDSREDVVVIPRDAVFTRGERTLCYVRRRGEVVDQQVVLGLTSETHAEVKSGVEAGEELLLDAPVEQVRRVDLPEPSA